MRSEGVTARQPTTNTLRAVDGNSREAMTRYGYDGLHERLGLLGFSIIWSDLSVLVQAVEPTPVPIPKRENP